MYIVLVYFFISWFSEICRETATSNSNPPPEIPKALQNRAKLNPIVKTVKNCWI